MRVDPATTVLRAMPLDKEHHYGPCLWITDVCSLRAMPMGYLLSSDYGPCLWNACFRYDGPCPWIDDLVLRALPMDEVQAKYTKNIHAVIIAIFIIVRHGASDSQMRVGSTHTVLGASPLY